MGLPLPRLAQDDCEKIDSSVKPLRVLLGIAVLVLATPSPILRQEPAARVDDPAPPTARWEQVQTWRSDLQAERHPADGGGSFRLDLAEGTEGTEGNRLEVQVGTSARIPLVYTAGPLGVAQGGALHFMPNPYWGWSVPQTTHEHRPGYSEVTTDAQGVVLETFFIGTAEAGTLVIQVGGRGLAEGEQVRIVYGAGALGARVDRHAERGSRLWLYVDGDGDGVRGLLADSPSVDVLPGPPARLVLTGPSVARPGERVRFTAAVLDAQGDAGLSVAGTLRISQRPDGWEVPETVELQPEDLGSATFEVLAGTPGVARLRATLELGELLLEDEANPLWVAAEVPRVLWGDLHGHSNYSDGTGLPEDYYRYARDVAGLDVAVLTDHDHFGARFIDQNPEMWEEIARVTEAFHEPGRFVTVLGYEWTSWIHGHRHVLYFSGEGEVLSSLDPAYETPRQLWEALRGRDALTFAHHSAGDPIPTNWTFLPDPELEPVTEIMSVHGSSEAADCPRVLRRPVRGNFVRDVLDRGVQLGFVGSGDGHDGHPGLAHLSPVYGWVSEDRIGTGGLAGILAEERTRPALLAALRARRTYATSGPRILLHATLEGHAMGEALPADGLPEDAVLRVVVIGTAGLARIDLVRPSAVTSFQLGGELRFVGDIPLGQLAAGGYVYLRVLQVDGAMAWTSPFFLK